MPRKRTAINNLDGISAAIAKSDIPGMSSSLRTIEFERPLKLMREKIRSDCPDAPGVYCMVNQDQHVTYVGMSTSLVKRLATYFTQQRARRKESRIRRSNVSLLWQPVDHELLARLRERELIRRFRPAWNVQGHPTQLKTGYIIETGGDAPSFKLVGAIPNNSLDTWGPIPWNRWSIAAVEQLNLHYQLRDCPASTPMQFSGSSVNHSIVPACLRADLKTCLRPCLGECTKKQYHRAVKRAQEFLSGKSKVLFSQVEDEMRRESTSHNFEKAALLRDRLKSFRYIHERLRRFHDWTSTANFVFECESAIHQRTIWVIIVRGIIKDVIAKPTSDHERMNAQQQIKDAERFVSANASQESSTYSGEFELSRIMFRWFRRHPDEVKNQISFRNALRYCKQVKRRAS